MKDMDTVTDLITSPRVQVSRHSEIYQQVTRRHDPPSEAGGSGRVVRDFNVHW